MHRTGYFADTKTYTKVHIVNDFTKPICGAKVSDKKSFQFNANFIVFEYVECESCKKKVRSLK